MRPLTFPERPRLTTFEFNRSSRPPKKLKVDEMPRNVLGRVRIDSWYSFLVSLTLLVATGSLLSKRSRLTRPPAEKPGEKRQPSSVADPRVCRGLVFPPDW